MWHSFVDDFKTVVPGVWISIAVEFVRKACTSGTLPRPWWPPTMASPLNNEEIFHKKSSKILPLSDVHSSFYYVFFFFEVAVFGVKIL